jgi:hypothetical protein
MEACEAYAVSIGQNANYCSEGWGCQAVPSLVEVCDATSSSDNTCDNFCWVYQGSGEVGWVTTCANCEGESSTWN